MTVRLFRCLLLSACALASSIGYAGPKVLPVLNQPISDRSGLSGFPLTVNLSAAFGTEVIDDQVVRFTSQVFPPNDQPLVIDMALFLNRTPISRTNFLKYVTDGDYTNSIIHRSVPGFVIQGGGFRVNVNSLEAVPTDAPIVNEFGVSNTLGTVSMAKLGGDPNSATSQWFISMGPNSDNLDYQNGGFTVFGRVTQGSFGSAQRFGNSQGEFPIFNYGGDLSSIPLLNTHVPPQIFIEQLALFPTASLQPLPAGQAGESTTLLYTVLSNSNPSLVATSVSGGNLLNLSPQSGMTGSATITVRATDSVGNTVDDTFVLTVNASDTFNTWISRTNTAVNASGLTANPDGDGLNNLLEYAFLGDPNSPSSGVSPIMGKTGTLPAPQYLTIQFPVRKFTTGLRYRVLGSSSLTGGWTEVWNSNSGFGVSSVLSAVNQSDRTVVTIRDTVGIGSISKRFLRVEVVQN